MKFFFSANADQNGKKQHIGIHTGEDSGIATSPHQFLDTSDGIFLIFFTLKYC